MGVAWQYVDILSSIGALGAGSGAVLDIGSSNLYSANAFSIKNFVTKYNIQPREDLEDFANRMEYGAAYDPVYGGRNGSFLGEVLEAAGFEYDAIDIAQGYKTTVVDLNVQNIPPHMVGKYDLVINSGTTEHILNQYNSFKAIHDATKSGGFIWNSVPAVGYLDHGYFCYTGKFFFDLAKFNDYEIIDMWFDGPAGPESVFASVESAGSSVEAAPKRLSRIGVDARETAIAALKIPTVGISFVYRKRSARPFMGTIETSTSVGVIPDAVTETYTAREVAPVVASLVGGRWSRLRDRLFG